MERTATAGGGRGRIEQARSPWRPLIGLTLFSMESATIQMPVRSNRRTLIAILLLAAAIGTAGLWLWTSEPRREIVFRSNVGNDFELLVVYQDTKGRLDADRLMFGDVSGTLSYAFVSGGSFIRTLIAVSDSLGMQTAISFSQTLLGATRGQSMQPHRFCVVVKNRGCA